MSIIHLPTITTKRPLFAKQVWAIRARLELSDNLRDLALFDLAIDSKLRGRDLVRLNVADLVTGARVRECVTVVQSKTKRLVQFEVSEKNRQSIWTWVCRPEMLGCTFLFPSRFHEKPHISTRQYARLVRDWVSAIGLALPQKQFGSQISWPDLHKNPASFEQFPFSRNRHAQRS